MDKKKIDKAIKKRKGGCVKRWFRKNRGIILPIIFWYIWLPMLIIDKIKEHNYKTFVENPRKTKRYFDKAFVKLIAFECDDPTIIEVGLNFDEADLSVRSFLYAPCLKGKHKRYFYRLGKERLSQIISEYEIDGYKKLYLDNWIAWDKAQQKFGWIENWDKDWEKAIVFYIEEDKNA